MDLLSYGDGIPEGDYRLHSAFEHAVNFRKGRLIISLVSPGAGAGPVNLVVKQIPVGARKFRATKFAFYIDDNRLRKAPGAMYDSSVPELDAEPALVRENIETLKVFFAVNAPPRSMRFVLDPDAELEFRRVFERKMLSRMKKAVALLSAGAYAAGAKMMRGLGFGLTPSGDDFLSGMLAGFSFARISLRLNTEKAALAVYKNSEGGNIISNTFLRCSYEGMVTLKIKRLMLALCGSGKRELLSAAADALKSGHTSGADFCAGLVFALQDALVDGK